MFQGAFYQPHVSFLTVTECRLRAYIGYRPVRFTEPNPTHYALAALQYAGIAPQLITQNVDGLHTKAASRVWDDANIAAHVLELHGTIYVRYFAFL